MELAFWPQEEEEQKQSHLLSSPVDQIPSSGVVLHLDSFIQSLVWNLNSKVLQTSRFVSFHCDHLFFLPAHFRLSFFSGPPSTISQCGLQPCGLMPDSSPAPGQIYVLILATVTNPMREVSEFWWFHQEQKSSLLARVAEPEDVDLRLSGAILPSRERSLKRKQSREMVTCMFAGSDWEPELSHTQGQTLPLPPTEL